MSPPLSTPPTDGTQQRAQDRRRLQRAIVASLAAVLGLCAVFAAQPWLPVRALAVAARDPAGLPGIVTAPLLHGSGEHLLTNAVGVLMLGTLAGLAYPKAALRALPLLWLGSGLGAWWLGPAGSHHLGASGVTHGLMFLVFALGLLRRDRASIAAAMLAFAFYGGMLLTILPREAGVSWQSHLGGALAGVLAAFLFRRSDPAPPRRRYSWEIEEAQDAARREAERAQWEPPRPHAVPVAWRRDAHSGDGGGVVLPFPASGTRAARRDRTGDAGRGD